MQHIAHITADGRIQTCKEHCRNAAEFAGQDLKGINLYHAGYLAGLLHDCGKFSNAFNTYITDAAAGKSVRKGSVIHSFAGVNYLLKKYHNEKQLQETGLGFEQVSAEILAYAIGAHHGLFDCVDTLGKNGFEHRMNAQPEYEECAVEAFMRECADSEELETLFERACSELTFAMKKFCDKAKSEKEVLFYEGMLARLIASSVMDGDRRDTAIFMGSKDFAKTVSANRKLWDDAKKHMEAYLSTIPCDTLLQKAREELSDYCKAFAEHSPGIYRLNLPTGAGKTLSGMRFALEHSRLYGKKRIIYVAPLISILEQNAQVIRQAVGREDIVLEHHSNILIDRDEPEQFKRRELLEETWESPIIITTMVQFMNALFSGKTSCVRRMQSLCDSIIILDEVQTLPTNLITMFDLAMNFLYYDCNATVLLCSATQPSLEKVDHPIDVSNESFIPKDKWEHYYNVFKRTNITDSGSYRLDEIPGFLNQITGETESILVICNKKQEAKYLFQYFEKTGWKKFHLSSAMCMDHRERVLADMYQNLENHRKIICFSTQVIEAGVDISFSTVVRFTAGLDSIVQAAGRCNRNGEQDKPAEVYVIQCKNESLKMLPSIGAARDATTELLEAYRREPGRFGSDLASDNAVRYYYRILYRRMPRDHQDDYVLKNREKKCVFSLLSDNADNVGDNVKWREKYFTLQAFREAGTLFEMIDRKAQSVIVPYGEGRGIIAEMLSDNAFYDLDYRRKLLTRAKKYTVSAYNYQIDKLRKDKGLHSVWDGAVLILDELYYNQSFGLDENGGDDNCNIQIL